MSIQATSDEVDFRQIIEEEKLYEPEADLDVPDENKKLSRKEKILASTIIGGNFLISVCFTVLAAFFPQSALKKGATETETGFIFSVFSLSTMICSPFMGVILPYIGARFMFISSVFMVGGTTLLFAFVIDAPSGLPFVALSMAIRIISGIGYITYKAATFSTIASQFPGKVATLMGINAGAFGVGVSLGPFIGGSLFDIGGFKLPFFVMSGLLFVTLVLMTFVLPPLSQNHREKLAEQAMQKKWSFFDIYMTPILYLPFLSILVAEMANAFLDLAIAPQVTKEFGVSATIAGSLFIPYQAAYAITCPVVGYICDKKHCERGSMAVGIFVQALAFLLLGPAPFINIQGSIWLTETALIMNAVGQAAAFIPGYKSIYRSALEKGFPDTLKTKSKISGLVLLGMGSGQFIGPSLGGIFIQHYGYRWGCTAITIISLVPGIFLTGLISKNTIMKVKARKQGEEREKLLD